MKTFACIAVLGLAGLMTACGGDSGGGTAVGSDPIVGTWRVDGADLKAKMGKMLDEQVASGQMPAEARGMAEGMMDGMMKSMIDNLRFEARADGTYTGTGPKSGDGAEQEFESKTGKWKKVGDTYECADDSDPTDKVMIKVVDGHLEFKPAEAPFAFVMVRA